MRRWLWVAGLYAVITLAFVYPILLQFGSGVPHDAGDPLLNTWILWWNTQALPLTARWWNAPMFYPMQGTLALSEVLVGLLPISAPVQWATGNPIAAYNLAFVLSFPLSGLAAYGLALEVTGERDAAILSGVAFAFAPYRMGQLAHVQMLSYYWAPLALLGLHRYRRTTALRWLVVFALSWLMQALSNGYALFHLSVIIVVWIVWFARPIRTAIPIVLAWIVAAIPLVPLLLTYRTVQRSLHLVRDINEIKRFGADLSDFASAPQDTILWGARLWTARPETAMFPGLTVLAIGAVWLFLRWHRPPMNAQDTTPDRTLWLVLSGVAALIAFSTLTFGPWSIGPISVRDFHKPFSIAVAARLLASIRSPWMRRAWREQSVVIFFVVALAASYLLALGPEPRVLGRPLLYEPPYAWLMRVPGFETLRVPARFAMLGVLSQSVLLGLAVARWPQTWRRPLVLTVVLLGLLADGWARLPVHAVPAPDGADWAGATAVLELPPGDAFDDTAALFRSIARRLPTVNGYSSYNAPHYIPLAHALRDGQFSVLHEIAPTATVGVAVSLARPDAADIAASLARVDGVDQGRVTPGWTTFLVRPRPRPDVVVGDLVPFRSVVVNRHAEDVARLSDGSLETAGTGVGQIGDEELMIDLGEEQLVGSLVLDMGAFAFGFPRALEIDKSGDGTAWTPLWGGRTATLTVHAAIAHPSTVPVAIDFARVATRFLRVRQVGAEPGIPWWIAELEIHRPAAGPGSR